MSGKNRLPNPALVIAVIALFVALGGTGYAAVVLPKNSVGAPQLKNGAVTPTKVAKRTIALFKGQQGPQGAQGEPGPKGDTGPSGPNSAAALVSVKTGNFFLAQDGESFFAATCGAGEKAVSGGFSTEQSVVAFDMHPSADGTGWRLYLVNMSAGGASGTVYAVCVG